MKHIDDDALRRAEYSRGTLLTRATGSLQGIARRADELHWDDPGLAAAELRGAVLEGLLALAQMAEVAGFFDGMATVRFCSLDDD